MISRVQNNNSLPIPPIAPKVEIPIQREVQKINNENFNIQQNNIQSFPTTTREMKINSEDDFQQKEEQPFFVRIDKFNSSKNNFLSIERKINELENIISTIDKIREKESEEIIEWKEQTESIKELLSQIDKDIFGKL